MQVDRVVEATFVSADTDGNGGIDFAEVSLTKIQMLWLRACIFAEIHLRSFLWLLLWLLTQLKWHHSCKITFLTVIDFLELVIVSLLPVFVESMMTFNAIQLSLLLSPRSVPPVVPKQPTFLLPLNGGPGRLSCLTNLLRMLQFSQLAATQPSLLESLSISASRVRGLEGIVPSQQQQQQQQQPVPQR